MHTTGLIDCLREKTYVLLIYSFTIIPEKMDKLERKNAVMRKLTIMEHTWTRNGRWSTQALLEHTLGI